MADIKKSVPVGTLAKIIKEVDEDTSLDSVIKERRGQHGAFTDHARATQAFKRVFRNELAKRHERKQPPLSDTQKEAIEMILHKIGRMVAGDPSFPDHAVDIQGYAKIANMKDTGNV